MASKAELSILESFEEVRDILVKVSGHGIGAVAVANEAIGIGLVTG